MQLFHFFLFLFSVNAIPHIVIFKPSTTKAIYDKTIKDYKIQVTHRFNNNFMGFAADLNDAAVAALKGNQNVASIEKDQIVMEEMVTSSNSSNSEPIVPGKKANPPPKRSNSITPQGTISVTQSVYSWGLARICKTAKPTSFATYSYPDTAGSGVDVYVLDSGINISLPEFEGRASYGKNFITNTLDCMDDNGHGTHVAGTVGSKSFGVAKKATLIAVKVLGSNGSGSLSGVIAGIDWIVNEKKRRGRNSVMNVSLGMPYSSAFNTAITSASQNGVHVVVAAGNSNANACNFSPSGAARTIAVGASDIKDIRATFSNYGNCVTMYAPGVDITSLWYLDPNYVATASGTSMASPHVAGLAALYLSTPAYSKYSTSQLKKTLISHTTRNMIKGIPSGPNYLASSVRLL